MSGHPDPTITATLERYAQLVESSPHNLVSRSARAELTTRHVPEAVALAGLLPSGIGRLLDLGSGGGFPGMVVAIVRQDLEVHLLDATRKKTAFLEQAATELGVPVVVHTGRAEELARGELAGSFDVVTARAVAPLDRLVPWALPFLSPGGVLYAVKGQRWREELEQAAGVIQRLGGHVVATPDDLPPASAQDAGHRPDVVMIARAA